MQMLPGPGRASIHEFKGVYSDEWHILSFATASAQIQRIKFSADGRLTRFARMVTLFCKKGHLFVQEGIPYFARRVTLFCKKDYLILREGLPYFARRVTLICKKGYLTWQEGLPYLARRVTLSCRGALGPRLFS